MDFTNDIVRAIVKDYEAGVGTPTLSKKYKSNYNTILRLLRHEGVGIRTFKMLRKTDVNHNYFSVVGPDQAYWLGFLYADGAVFPPGHQKSGKISLVCKESDIDHTLVKLKESLGYSGSIKTYTNKNSPFTGKPYTYGRLLITSDRLVEDLCALGCVPRKTFVLTSPPIPIGLRWDFIRGYTDGDGAISIYRDTKGYATAQFKFCGTKELLTWVDGCFCELLGRRPHKLYKRWKDRDNNNWALSIYVSQTDMKKVLNVIDGKLWMPRKRQKVVEYLAWPTRI